MALRKPDLHAVMDLRLLIGEHEAELLSVAQERWQEYRRALEKRALREFAGGTHAPLPSGWFRGVKLRCLRPAYRGKTNA
jgi:hypothetical protein